MRKTTTDTFEDFKCITCDINTFYIHEYYMIQDDLWKKVNPKKKGMMCIGCVELKLGRTLTSGDFPDYPVNSLNFFRQSERLVNRLTRS